MSNARLHISNWTLLEVMSFKSKLDNKQNMVGKLENNSHGFGTAIDLFI